MPIPTILHPMNDVRAMQVLAPEKVFLMVLTDGSRLVMKREIMKAQNNDTLKQGRTLDLVYQVTTSLGGTGRARPMDMKEVCDFSHVTGRFADPDFAWQKVFTMTRNREVTWVLMEEMSNLRNLEDAVGDQRGNGGPNQALALTLLGQMRRKEALIQLGRIIALDAFVGNSDRFNLQAFVGYTHETAPQQVDKWIVNWGNIFFVRDQQGHYTFTGLDSWDPNGAFAKFDQDVLQLVQTYDQRWTGYILKHENRLMKPLARGILTELFELTGRAAGPPLTAADWTPRSKEVEYVVRGMKAGAQQMKTICKTRLKPGVGRMQAPDGLKSRMKFLHWS